jgi:hypothetical protein
MPNPTQHKAKLAAYAEGKDSLALRSDAPRIAAELIALVVRGNYIRIFDESRRNMRAWERAHPEEVA